MLVIKMNYEIVDVKSDKKEKLYKLLQYALYDGVEWGNCDKKISKKALANTTYLVSVDDDDKIIVLCGWFYV